MKNPKFKFKCETYIYKDGKYLGYLNATINWGVCIQFFPAGQEKSLAFHWNSMQRARAGVKRLYQ